MLKVKGGNRPVHEQLRDALAGSSAKVMDLFREFDENGDGGISKDEWARAMPMLGIAAPREVHDQIFDEFDALGHGVLSVRDFNKLLKKANEDAKEAKKNRGQPAEKVVVASLADIRKEVARDMGQLEMELNAASRARAADPDDDW